MKSIFVTLAIVTMAYGQSAPAVVSAVGAPDAVTPQLRQARGTAFDDPGMPKLENLSPGTPQSTLHVRLAPDIPELPTKGVDVILVGQLNGSQAYQSNDHSNVYTESTVLVQQVFNQQSGNANVGDTIALNQYGGTIILPAGQAIGVVTKGAGNPLQINERYLFFLIYSNGGQCYRVFKTWWLAGGRAVAMSTDDLMRVKAGTSKYHNMPESAILATAKALVLTPFQ
jgi:hypothetical protein